MKLKLIFFVVVLVCLKDSSCMEIFTWLGYKFNPKSNIIKTEDVKNPEIEKYAYIKSIYDETPDKQSILKARDNLKKLGINNPDLRFKSLENIIGNNLDNSQNLVENIIIASYSTKDPQYFKMDYAKFILLLSKVINNNNFDPEVIFKILIRMPTFYAILNQLGFDENSKEASYFILLYANLLLDIQQTKLRSVLNYEKKDTLLKILIGKTGGSINLLRLVNESVEQEVKLYAEKTAKIENNLLDTSNNFEKAEIRKTDSIHVWTLINQRIKLVKDS